MSTLILAMAHLKGPHIDWASFMPFVILGVGALVVLLIGLFGAVARTVVVPLVTVGVLVASIVIEATRLDHPASIISGALAVDGLALVLDMIFAVSAIAAVVLSLREQAPRSAGHGEYNALLLFSVLGMAILVSSQNLVTLFVGFELLSIPLYVLCASEFRREGSLESGLKYLVIGSVGAATLVYGLAMVYGATGSTQFAGISNALLTGNGGSGLLGDPLLLTGLGLVIVGFAFKASVAPFHQWTPDVYEGAPTPVTAFMATATKAAALGVLLRFFDVAVIHVHSTWAPALATIAAITIIVGNVGALGQTSLKRLLAYSSVAQAGYMLSGVIVATELGVNATVLYLGLYMFMNLTAFAVIIAVQIERADGDELSGMAGLGRRNPWLAWPMSIAMLALAGIPGTVGFIGKFQLIHALVDGGYTWLAIVLVIGSMISLAYYLRVIATLWMRDEVPAPSRDLRGALMGGRGGLAPIAGGSSEADKDEGGFATAPRSSSVGAAWRAPEVTAVAVLFGAATVFFGIFPSVLFDFAAHAGRALGLT